MGNLADWFKQNISQSQQSVSDLGDQLLKQNAASRLSAQQAQQQSGLSAQQAQQERGAALQKQQIGKQNLQTLLGSVKGLPPGAGAGVDGASITRGLPTWQQGMQQQKLETAQENKYSGALGKFSDADAALHAVEDATNSDGKGGILTNNSAQLKSGGKTLSVLPDQGVAIAEALGQAPAGAAEERKAISRFKLSLGHAFTGARMSPAMQKAIGDSLGQMGSSDPALQAKGIRGAAGILGAQIKTAGAGFNDETRGAVHDRLGGDPNEFYGRVYKDTPGGQAQPVAGAPATSPAPGATGGQPMSFDDWKKANGR